MHKFFNNIIFGLPRPLKRAIQVGSDCTLIIFCFWLAMALRLDGIFTQIKPHSWLTLAAVIPGTIVTFACLGLYRAVVRFMAEKAVVVIVVGASVSSALAFIASQFFALEVPRSVPGIYFSLLVLATGGTRLLMRTAYLALKDIGRMPIVVYGAGDTGRLVARALMESKNYRPCLFIDDNKALQGTQIMGIPIVSLELAEKKISEISLKTALIAFQDKNLQKQAAKRMVSLGLEVRIVPEMSDLLSGRVKVSNMRRLKIEELLGRDTVKASSTLMARTTYSKSVMVTGAGGSIGTELCRQLIRQAPYRLVVLDVSEYALYTLVEELTEIIKSEQYEVVLVPLLGSITQQNVIERAIIEHEVDTLYHAAAYKHVPMVENNAAEALKNNALGTHLLARAAGRNGVKHFTLISTDKAVRPTNIMGATKRLAELAVLAAATIYPKTKFCSVRFGNVLGSSGSVVPKFEKQIEAGGPLTVTHPEILRYFMTISEAAQLVIQASAMADRGDVFLLDMGEPVLILDLARKMCALQGKTLHTDKTKEAGQDVIEVQFTGLRPGEKLYEELLVTGTETQTSHPRIKCEKSPITMELDVESVLDNLLKLRGNKEIAHALSALPLGYTIDQRHNAGADGSQE